jgi:hypothetical protein
MPASCGARCRCERATPRRPALPPLPPPRASFSDCRPGRRAPVLPRCAPPPPAPCPLPLRRDAPAAHCCPSTLAAPRIFTPAAGAHMSPPLLLTFPPRAVLTPCCDTHLPVKPPAAPDPSICQRTLTEKPAPNGLCTRLCPCFGAARGARPACKRPKSSAEAQPSVLGGWQHLALQRCRFPPVWPRPHHLPPRSPSPAPPPTRPPPHTPAPPVPTNPHRRHAPRRWPAKPPRAAAARRRAAGAVGGARAGAA